MFSSDDTIVAIATPPGRGGIGVVRLSGPDAHRVAQALTGRTDPFEPRHATLTRVIDDGAEGAAVRVVDQAVVTWFAAPHSYTGEDVVEISGHGSPVLLQRIVDLAMARGARLAEPGEFTLRAYLHGRLDLVQAEAVVDLVDAVTPLQARAAMDQLEGTLTGEIGRIDRALLDLSAKLEASLDFPDEGFHFITREATRDAATAIRGALAALAAGGRAGRVVREGRLVVIVGRPNAGKSSLFNALVGADRAIVTNVPGTTRDMLTERVDIAGVPITLVDTAGLRASADAIEVEGVSRARKAASIAALTVLVLDRSEPFTEADRAMLDETRGDRLIVLNKVDLDPAWSIDTVDVDETSVVDLSATTGFGLKRLRERIVAALVGEDGRSREREAPAITNVRHVSLVDAAQASMDRCLAAIDAGVTEELVLIDLTAARQSLEAITGRRTAEDVLRHIFATFCVGK